MRILHTSDWHVGRTFHGFDTLDALRTVLDALVREVAEREVDVVLVAGDVYDTAMPSARHVELLTTALRSLRDAGATLVLTSGNHDSAPRLGANAGFASAGGLHLLTTPGAPPVELADEHGPVLVFGIPYLEPLLLRDTLEGEEIRSHEQAIRWAMRGVRERLAERPARSVVLAHCFAAGVHGALDDDAPRDITAGGLQVVPLDAFDGVDYVALGHLHSRQELSAGVRYSGAPLHYSFAERSPERGGWLVELGADGLESVDWVALPVPRALTELRGELDALLADPALAGTEDDYVRATLTDATRPVDAMRALQRRWPRCAAIEWERPDGGQRSERSYAERIAKRSEAEVVDSFLAHVRDGIGASGAERSIVAEAFARLEAAESGR